MYRIVQASCRSTFRNDLLHYHSYHASPHRLTSQLRTTEKAYDQPERPGPLGIRSQRPPDSNFERSPRDSTPPYISDQEWEIRTGRAIYLLQNTLPEFFSAGLVTSVDKTTGLPKSLTPSIPVINANPLDYQTWTEGNTEMIYSPKIGLSYTPPVALPPPFPTTLHIEGLPLYLASAVFVRHTLNALYSDLSLTLNKVSVNMPGSPTAAAHVPSGEETKPQSQPQPKKRQRQKNLSISFSVTGKSRVSGTRGEWEVKGTYSFSPSTGLINKHTVDSIYPAPHQAVYDSLRSSLGKLFGIGVEGSPRPGPGGTACSAGGSNGVEERGR